MKLILSFLFISLFQTVTLNADTAAKKVGEQVTVKDKIAGSRMFERDNNKTLLINLSKPYPETPLTIVIKNKVLDSANLKQIDNKMITVTGKVSVFKERAQIEISETSQIISID